METELISSQLTTAYAASAMIEWLKHQSWFPFVDVDAAKLNRVFSVVIAIVTAVGIHLTFDQTAGEMRITGLTASNIGHAAWASVQQYAMQQGIFKALIQSTDKNGSKGSPGGSE